MNAPQLLGWRQLGSLMLACGLLSLSATLGSSAPRPGDLDRSFGSDGRVVTRFATHRYAVAAAIGADGRIVAAGWGTDCLAKVGSYCSVPLSLARYLPDGNRDHTFGGDGRVSVRLFNDFGDSGGGPLEVALQPDNKVVVAAQSQVVRFNPNGSFDPTFGRRGRVVVRGVQGFTEDLRGLAVVSGGRILVTGDDQGADGTDFGLMRLNPNGTIDRSFGHRGRVRTDFGRCDQPFALAVGPQGAIVVAGQGIRSDCRPTGPVKFEMAKYGAEGRLDPSFGVDGRLVEGTRDDGGIVGGLDLALTPAGGIVSLLDFGLRRYTPNGRRVWSFGQDGKAVVPGGAKSGELPISIALDDKGRILVGGTSYHYFDRCCGHFELFRFLRTGTLDRGFGTDGQVLTGFGGQAYIFDVLVDGLNRIVAVGATNWQEGNFGLARYASY